MLGQIPTHTLDRVFPPGGQSGGTTEIDIAVGELDHVSGLRFSHPGIRAEAIPGTPSRFRVTIASEVPAGLHELIALGRYGASNPRRFAVGHLPEVADSAGTFQLDHTINGRVDPGRADTIEFEARKGQPVTADCLATRIDSRMDATLTLFGPDGERLAEARNDIALDPVLAVTAPADGRYRLEVFDVTYGGGADHFYRLRLHTGPHIHSVFPPAVQAGRKTEVTLTGHNLPGETREVEIQAPAQAEFGGFIRPHESPRGFNYVLDGRSNPVRIGLVDQPVTTPAAGQPLAVPGTYADRFEGEPKRYRFRGGDSKLVVELLCHRLGQANDPAFLLRKVTRKDKGEETFQDLNDIDDTDPGLREQKPIVFKHRDPVHTFQPEKDQEYEIVVRDQFTHRRAVPFLLSLREATPRFDLVATHQPPGTDPKKPQPGMPQLLRGGSAVVAVQVRREDGHNAPVELRVEGLPPGLSADAPPIAAGATSGRVVFRAAAEGDLGSGAVRIVGRDASGLEREAWMATLVHKANNLAEEFHLPRLTSTIAVGAYAHLPTPATVRAKEEKTWEATIGGKLTLPVVIETSGPLKGDIKVVPVGIPGLNKPPELKLKEDKREGELAFNFANANNNKFEAGECRFVLRVEGTRKGIKLDEDLIGPAAEQQKRAAENIKKAEQAQREADKARNETKAAADQARAAREAAQRKGDEAALKSAREKEAATKQAREEAERRASQAKADLDAAKKRKQEADQARKKADDRAKPRDMKFVEHSKPIHLRLAAKPKEEPAKP